MKEHKRRFDEGAVKLILVYFLGCKESREGEDEGESAGF